MTWADLQRLLRPSSGHSRDVYPNATQRDRPGTQCDERLPCGRLGRRQRAGIYGAPVIRIVSWNVGRRDLWQDVAAGDQHLALLQEVGRPTGDLGLQVVPGPDEAWETSGPESRPWRTAVAATPELALRPYRTAPRHQAAAGTLAVSRPGTLTAADVLRDGEPVLTAVSVYGTWESPLTGEGPIFSDASGHQILSDIAPLVTGRDGHRLLVAGDWNMLFGYAEDGDAYWAGRIRSVFDRAETMGLVFLGPQSPNGRQADPWPPELPRTSRNVPTFHDAEQTPATATRQTDYVFASESIADRVQATAMNAPEEWGASDHCRVSIAVDL
jgi:hypothetical protein